MSLDLKRFRCLYWKTGHKYRGRYLFFICI